MVLGLIKSEEDIVMNSNSNKQRQVLTALGNGSTVSKLTALHEGIGNVHDVIMRLRRYGWEISTDTKYDLNGRKYTSYSLVERQRAAARHRAAVMVAS